MAADEGLVDRRMSIFAAGLLDGRTALITGGATGLGFAIASEFARLGARTVLAGRKQENLDAAVEKLTASGAQTIAVQTDVRQFDQVEKAVAAAVDRFGSLDILVNGAAGNFYCPTEDLSPNGWRTVVDIDLNGTFLCCKAAFPALKTSTYEGRIISIVTTLGPLGWPGQAHAGAAKAGIVSLSRALAVEWAKHKIHVNTISPGPIGGTEGVRKLYEDRGALEEQLRRVALNRLGEPRDIANAAVYLASPAGDFVTGADLIVDGGRWLNYV
jgi:NAD(P)-dependent dehydrogenase (short-subunit alcohol dehydrogenase family)